VYVHEVGAPHLVDPQKLLESASRLYGDAMQRLWGEVLPVPASSVVALSGGEEIEGFRVAHVPGHANHHVAYLHEATGDAYVGDVAGVRILRAGRRKRRRRRTSTSRRSVTETVAEWLLQHSA
jgi:glyoxylase-like metal-dependent hydrolase (beta-lactamase superfamily II)